MYKILTMSTVLLATSVLAEEIRIVPDIKRELPIHISEPDLYSEPGFKVLEFGPIEGFEDKFKILMQKVTILFLKLTHMIKS